MNLFFKAVLLFGLIGSAQAGVPVLYIYGDVSADGDIPSGEKEPFQQMRLNDSGKYGMSEFKEAIEEVGFDIAEKYDAEIELNDSFLNQYRVIMLASNQRMFCPAEVAAIHKWVEQGGGLIAWSDSAFGGHYRKVGIGNTQGRDSNNLITEKYGMYFLTDNGGGNYLISQYDEDHYLNDNNRNAGIRYRGEGVSCVRVSSPARVLARLQEGGLGGKMEVNKVDGIYQPENDAALAVAESGKGRVVGTFDRNCFWNAGDGSRLSHCDNREFTQRMVVWAAGLEKEVEIVGKPLPKSGVPNQPPKVSAGKDQMVKQLQADLVGTVSDDSQLKRFPEIRWSVRKSQGKVTFENDNPNAATVRVFFSKPGKYNFILTADDGEFSIRDYVTVTVKP
ncbi:hypothetical protein P4C99_06885 [Pontiellaceae bacterium B1224]|nr:hypothetical protein [Pontiellaceae bacterium B1224]